jgi:hypothetical protein
VTTRRFGWQRTTTFGAMPRGVCGGVATTRHRQPRALPARGHQAGFSGQLLHADTLQTRGEASRESARLSPSRLSPSRDASCFITREQDEHTHPSLTKHQPSAPSGLPSAHDIPATALLAPVRLNGCHPAERRRVPVTFEKRPERLRALSCRVMAMPPATVRAFCARTAPADGGPVMVLFELQEVVPRVGLRLLRVSYAWMMASSSRTRGTSTSAAVASQVRAVHARRLSETLKMLLDEGEQRCGSALAVRRRTDSGTVRIAEPAATVTSIARGAHPRRILLLQSPPWQQRCPTQNLNGLPLTALHMIHFDFETAATRRGHCD